MEHNSRAVSADECDIAKEGLDLNTAVCLLESLKDFVQSPRERYETFKEKAKEKTGKLTYIEIDCRKRKRKRFHDEIGEEPDVLDQLSKGESYRINNFVPIIDSLIAAISMRIGAYRGLSKKFGFFAKLGTGDITDDQLCFAAKNLVTSYSDDLEPELETEILHFNSFLKELQKAEAISKKKITESDMLLLIFENSVHEVFANVAIALKIYLCMFVTKCKGERSFSKLKLI